MKSTIITLLALSLLATGCGTRDYEDSTSSSSASSSGTKPAASGSGSTSADSSTPSAQQREQQKQQEAAEAAKLEAHDKQKESIRHKAGLAGATVVGGSVFVGSLLARELFKAFGKLVDRHLRTREPASPHTTSEASAAATEAAPSHNQDPHTGGLASAFLNVGKKMSASRIARRTAIAAACGYALLYIGAGKGFVPAIELPKLSFASKAPIVQPAAPSTPPASAPAPASNIFSPNLKEPWGVPPR
jgi:hypothetical protein